MLCIICNKVLTGQQRKFCSLKCKNSASNYKHQSYICQQKRAHNRKSELIELLGGKCELCGYNKFTGSLSFHHKNPKNKKFNLSVRECSNRSWDSLLTEVSKCSLLCLNCHSELHWNNT